MKLNESIPSSESPPLSNLDQDRRAHWLLSDYSEKTWLITNSHQPEITDTIDFRYILADGRCLTEVERLYATVKEYAWWIRDFRFSGISNANGHAQAVSYLLKITHALTLSKIGSFAHVQPYDIEELIEECRYGTDAVLHATERIDHYLNELEIENEIAPRPYGGLPRYFVECTGRFCNVVDTMRVIRDCNLPDSACRLTGVSARIAQATLANGLKVKGTRLNREPEPLRVQAIGTIRGWLDPLEQLFLMRRQMKAETIKFQPLPFGAWRVASVKGVGSKRTPTPPPPLMLHLLEHSARWVIDCNSKNLSDLKARTDIDLTTTACWILIAAFTACRAGGIDDLREGCVHGDRESGWWLDIYIAKTLQRNQMIPIPYLVVRAIETMSAISAAARLKTKSDRLFQWQRPDGEILRLDVTRKIDIFAAVVNVPPKYTSNDTVSIWHWSPHQFRRFFAVLYFYRFEGASIEVLSHHLRHFDLQMTKQYITEDAEVAALWLDVEWAYTGHVARSIVAGERSVSGAAGEKLKKTARGLIDLFRRKVRIVSPERLGASLKLIMQRKGLVLTPMPWVTCSAPTTHDAALKAACRRKNSVGAGDVGPNFAHAGPSVCCDCAHAITEGSRQSYVEAEIKHLDAVVSSGVRSDTLFGDLESARVVTLHRVRDTKYMAATPLKPAEITE